MEGATRGAGAGLGAVSGASLGAWGGALAGGGLGALGGAGIGALAGHLTGHDVGTSATVGALGGGGAAGLAGSLYGEYRGSKGGYRYANKLMGKPSWEQGAKKDKDDAPEKSASDPATQDQID